MRTHKTEFPQIEIPAEILSLVVSGQMIDESWGNDATPRFTFADGSMSLWIEHAVPANREFDAAKRFVVTGDVDGETELLFDAEKLPELLHYLADHFDLVSK